VPNDDVLAEAQSKLNDGSGLSRTLDLSLISCQSPITCAESTGCPPSTSRSAARGRAPWRCRGGLGQQGPNLFPLGVGQQPTISRHRPSLWRYSSHRPPPPTNRTRYPLPIQGLAPLFCNSF
jgi:hypothetical protein